MKLSGYVVAGISALLLARAVCAQDTLVVADFEDVGTWRARPAAGVPPEGWFSGNLFLASSDLDKRNGNWVGELRYKFAGEKGPYRLSLEREKMSRTAVFIKAISFDANAKGSDCSLAFEIEDSRKAKYVTSPVPLAGDTWQSYRLDLNEKTVPGFAKIRFPAVLRRIFLTKATPGTGSIFLDDIALVGRVSSSNLLTIRPVYDSLSHQPGAPVKLAYHVSNASATAQSGEAVLTIGEVRGGPTREFRQRFSIPANGETEIPFSLGTLPEGAWYGQLVLAAEEARASYLDFFGVFEPNGKQVNTQPMLFGVQDMTSWQGESESALHVAWMKMLGVNLTRLGIVGPYLAPHPGPISNEPLANMLTALGKADIGVLLLYSDAVPDWTQGTVAWRRPPTNWEAFGEHAAETGRWLSGFPNVRFLEFWNEPDVEFFKGTIPEYVGMLEKFSEKFRPAAPNIRLVSPGVTVLHPAEKPGMSKAIIQRPDLYDIAGFHSHGSASDFARRFDMVSGWMKETGQNRPIANTEAGFRSGYDIPGAMAQALVLVQKITEAKSRPGMEFYIWFTLQDYWDMDQKADDSLGLVTSDNRAKPSFVAYNELIRQLANTTPVGSLDWHQALTTYSFRKPDGRMVYVCTPRDGRATARLWVKSAAKYTLTDMFGRSTELSGDPALVTVSREPIYLAASAPDDPLQPVPPGESFLQIPESLTLDRDRTLSISIQNPWDAAITVKLTVRTEDGREIGQQEASVPAKGKQEAKIALPSELAPNFGLATVVVEATATGGHDSRVLMPVEIRSSYPVGKSLDAAPPIILDKSGDVVELAYDPFRPAWKGPNDLSADVRFARDEENLILRAVVTDATHVQNEAENALWNGDSLQLAIANTEGQVTELTFGLRNETQPAVWCSISPNPEHKGVWQLPFTARREDRKTIYEARIPLRDLGLKADGRPFRIAFVINNNDGAGRVRYLQWFGGIANHKNPDEFGFAALQ